MTSVNAKVVPFHEALTFTRASTKWVFDNTGTLVEVPIDQPAYDHDPVKGEALGVLIEPGATNEWPWSDDMSKMNGFGTIRSIDNVTADTNNSDHHFYPPLSSIDGLDRVLSLRVKQKGTQVTKVRIASLQGSVAASVNLSDGVVTGAGAELVKTHVENDGWLKIEALVTGSATQPRVYLESDTGVNFAGDGTSGVFVKNYQIETGSIATSYIPTAGAAVTRAADNMYRDVGNEINNQAVSFIVHADLSLMDSYTGGMARDVINFDTVSDNRRIYLRKENGPRVMLLSRSTDNEISTGTTMTETLDTDGESLFGVTISSTSRAAAYNGAAKLSSEQGLSQLPDTLRMLISLYGHLRSISYYPYAMTAAELEALTAP